MGVPYAEVIGDPITHSKSPLIHKFWLERGGVKADYRAVRVTATELSQYLASRSADADWRGCNVTMPLKLTAMEFVDALRPFAARARTLNTIFRKQDWLIGESTDGPGFLEAVEPILPDNGGISGEAIVYGSGGAARAIIYALRESGVMVSIAARNPLSAQHLAWEAGYPWVDWLKREDQSAPLLRVGSLRKGEVALIVNATPLGSIGNSHLDISLENVSDNVTVCELVYNPVETPLLRVARERGMRIIDGFAMLIGQAALSYELLFDAPAPRQHDAELRELLIR